MAEFAECPLAYDHDRLMEDLIYFVVVKQVIQAAAPSSRDLGLTSTSDTSAASTKLYRSKVSKQSKRYTELANHIRAAITASMAGGMHETTPTQSPHESKRPSLENLDIQKSSGFIAVNVDINKAGGYTCIVCNAIACQQHGVFINENGKKINQSCKWYLYAHNIPGICNTIRYLNIWSTVHWLIVCIKTQCAFWLNDPHIFSQYNRIGISHAKIANKTRLYLNLRQMVLALPRHGHMYVSSVSAGDNSSGVQVRTWGQYECVSVNQWGWDKDPCLVRGWLCQSVN